MPIFETSLADLVKMTCKLKLGDWVDGKATGGGNTTVIDTTNRVEGDDYFNSQNSKIYMLDGAARYQSRRITDFVSSTSTVTVPAFSNSASVASGDEYSIHTKFYREDVVEAINQAIREVQGKAIVEKIDEDSVVLYSDIFEYNVPPGFLVIYRLTMADADDYFFDSGQIPPDHYRIVRAGTPKIHFYQTHLDQKTQDQWYGVLWGESEFTAGRKIRIEGLGRQEVLVNDYDLCYINPAFISSLAASYLWAARIRRPENEPDDCRTQFKVWLDHANALRASTVNVLPPDSKKVS